MGRFSSTGTRRLLRVLAVSVVAICALATWALAAGPGGWDHLGDRGTPGTKSLNLVASALEPTPERLYVGGKFTDAGGILNADRIAKWNGSAWSAVSSSTEQITSGEVFAIAVAGGKVYAGGTFAAGNSGANNLAVWDGTSWEPFCTRPAETIGNVKALQIIGPTLYVGGDFQDGAGINTADYLLACDLATGTPRTTTLPSKVLRPGEGADRHQRREALRGRTVREPREQRGRRQHRLPRGTGWQPWAHRRRPLRLRAGRVRTRAGRQRDQRVRRHGGIGRWRHRAGRPCREVGRVRLERHGREHRRYRRLVPHATNIYDLAIFGANVFATGTFQNADGDPRADNVAWFDGTDWNPVGSNGTGNGPWIGEGSALAIVDAALRGGELHERRW